MKTSINSSAIVSLVVVFIVKLVSVTVLVLLAASAFGQENGESRSGSPYFLVLSSDRSADHLPLKRTRAEMQEPALGDANYYYTAGSRCYDDAAACADECPTGKTRS